MNLEQKTKRSITCKIKKTCEGFRILSELKIESIKILLTIHPELLSLLDEYCKNRYMNRTEGMRTAIRKMVIKNDN